MKKLLSRTHSSDTSPNQIVYSPTKTSSTMKSLRSPKIENVDANDKIVNGHSAGNKSTNKEEGAEQKQKFIRLKNWITEKQVTDTLHQQRIRVNVIGIINCCTQKSKQFCTSTIRNVVDKVGSNPLLISYFKAANLKA